MKSVSCEYNLNKAIERALKLGRKRERQRINEIIKKGCGQPICGSRIFICGGLKGLCIRCNYLNNMTKQNDIS